MTDHSAYRDLLAMHHDLTHDEESTLTSHLESCPSCRALAEEYARQDAFLQALRLPEPPLTFGAGVLGKVHGEHRAARSSPWRHGLGLLSAAAVMVLLVLTVRSTSGTPGSPSRAADEGVYHASTHGPKNSPSYGSSYFGSQIPAGAMIPPTVTAETNGSPQSDAAASASIQRGKKSSFSTRVPTPTGSLQRGAGPALSVDRTYTSVSESHDLQLSLSVSRTTWPKDSVVPVRITIRNLTHQYVTVLGDGWQHRSCPSGRPGVEVIDAHGNPIYPPLDNNGPMPRCPAQLLTSPKRLLRPQRSLTFDTQVVLKANRLRAAASVVIYTGCNPTRQPGCTGSDVVVYGRSLKVHLTQ